MKIFQTIYLTYYGFFLRKIEGDKLTSHINSLLLLSTCQFLNLLTVWFPFRHLLDIKWTINSYYFIVAIILLFVLNLFFTKTDSKSKKEDESGLLSIMYTILSHGLALISFIIYRQ